MLESFLFDVKRLSHDPTDGYQEGELRHMGPMEHQDLKATGERQETNKKALS